MLEKWLDDFIAKCSSNTSWMTSYTSPYHLFQVAAQLYRDQTPSHFRCSDLRKERNRQKTWSCFYFEIYIDTSRSSRIWKFDHAFSICHVLSHENLLSRLHFAILTGFVHKPACPIFIGSMDAKWAAMASAPSATPNPNHRRYSHYPWERGPSSCTGVNDNSKIDPSNVLWSIHLATSLARSIGCEPKLLRTQEFKAAMDLWNAALRNANDKGLQQSWPQS